MFLQLAYICWINILEIVRKVILVRNRYYYVEIKLSIRESCVIKDTIYTIFWKTFLESTFSQLIYIVIYITMSTSVTVLYSKIITSKMFFFTRLSMLDNVFSTSKYLCLTLIKFVDVLQAKNPSGLRLITPTSTLSAMTSTL